MRDVVVESGADWDTTCVLLEQAFIMMNIEAQTKKTFTIIMLGACGDLPSSRPFRAAWIACCIISRSIWLGCMIGDVGTTFALGVSMLRLVHQLDRVCPSVLCHFHFNILRLTALTRCRVGHQLSRN